MKDSFVYIWNNVISGRKYIGYHKGKIDDGYVSSTTNDSFWEDYKNGKLIREIIFEGTRDECLKYEQDYLKSIDLKSDEWYNNARGAEIIFTQEVRDKIRNHHLGKPSGMLGKKHKKETIKKISTRVLDTESGKIYDSITDLAKDLGYKSRTFVYSQIKIGRFIYIDNDKRIFSEDHLSKLKKPNKNPGKKKTEDFSNQCRNRISDTSIYSFFNILTKEKFVGTRHQFSEKFNLAKHNIVGLVNKKTKILGGEWILES